MGAILDVVFEPNDIEAMSLAYVEVCDALHTNGDFGARVSIAERVIELARRGERCPTALRDRVLAEANVRHWVRRARLETNGDRASGRVSGMTEAA